MKKILRKNIEKNFRANTIDLIKKNIKENIKENMKEYFIFTMILLIGIIIGIVVLNNTCDEQKQQINNYLISFTDNIKYNSKVNYFEILKISIFQNLKFAIITIFISLSIFGIIGNFILIGYKGFCLGYTLSSVIAIFGASKGLVYGISLVFLSNVIYIPALFYLIIKSLKLYKCLHELSKEDIRKEISKYFGSIFLFLIALILSSIVTTYINSNVFIGIVKIY